MQFRDNMGERGGYYDPYHSFDVATSAGYHRLQQQRQVQAGLHRDYGIIPQHHRPFMPSIGDFSVGFPTGSPMLTSRDGNAGGLDIKPIMIAPELQDRDSNGAISTGLRHVTNRRRSCSPPFETVSQSSWSQERDSRRPRSERKPIAAEQKDDKYFERRHRNNDAAKRSRDARKQRMDMIIEQSGRLEQQNVMLRAQRRTLYEQLCTLRELAVKKDGKRLGFEVGRGGGTSERDS